MALKVEALPWVFRLGVWAAFGVLGAWCSWRGL